MARQNGYSLLQIILHWVIALLIVAAWWTSDGMGRALRARIESGRSGIEGNTLHVWFGGAVLALVLIRTSLRWMQGAPDTVAGTPPLLELAARWGHRLLYLLMFLAPLAGAAVWYLGLRPAGDVHELTANALMILALLHAAAALFHHFFLKDGTLMRMLRPAV